MKSEATDAAPAELQHVEYPSEEDWAKVVNSNQTRVFVCWVEKGKGRIVFSWVEVSKGVN